MDESTRMAFMIGKSEKSYLINEVKIAIGNFEHFRCFFRGSGGTVNVLRISGTQGYPECGTQRVSIRWKKASLFRNHFDSNAVPIK